MTRHHAIDFPHEIELVIDALRHARTDWRQGHARHAEHGVHFPSRDALQRIMRELGAALFPLRLGPPELHAGNESAYVAATLETVLDQLSAQLILEFDLAEPGRRTRDAAELAVAITGALAGSLADIRRTLDSDVEAGYRADPAAQSVDEILLCYPSLIAVIHHRIAHLLHVEGAPIVARIITEIAHQRTGIDIHPGARIGPSFFIDHGTGVVIGETAVLGARIHLHQSVTIGGLGTGRGERRHAYIGDDVTIYPGAALLGPVTIGAGSIIDSNVVVRSDVPPNTFVRAPEPVHHPLTVATIPTG